LLKCHDACNGVTPARLDFAEWKFPPLNIAEQVVYRLFRVTLTAATPDDGDVWMLVEKSGPRFQPTGNDLAITINEKYVRKGGLYLEQLAETLVSGASGSKWVSEIEFHDRYPKVSA